MLSHEFTDSFAANSRLTKWPRSSPGTSIDAGLARIPGAWGVLESQRAYTLHGSWMAVRLASSSGGDQFIDFSVDAGSKVRFYISPNWLEGSVAVGGVVTGVGGAVPPAPFPKWFAFSCSSDVLQWWTSLNGVAWTMWATMAKPAGLNLATTSGTMSASNGHPVAAMVVDAWNLPAAPPARATEQPRSGAISIGAITTRPADYPPGEKQDPALFMSPEAITSLETQLGSPLSVINVYRGWLEGGGPQVWPLPVGHGNSPYGDAALSRGRTLCVHWEPAEGYPFTSWYDGRLDGYLDAVIARCRAFADPIAVRFFGEMNGDWSRYQVKASGRGASNPQGGTPAEFIAAWRYVVKRFRSAGLTSDKVKWVFNPDASTYSGMTPIANFYPGNDYVDVVALDGYNWGGEASAPVTHQWQTFEQVYRTQYENLVSLAPGKPMWICEFGCADAESTAQQSLRRIASGPATKRQWLNNMGKNLASDFPAISTVCFFNLVGAHVGNRDWRVDSTPEGLLGSQELVRALTGASALPPPPPPPPLPPRYYLAPSGKWKHLKVTAL